MDSEHDPQGGARMKVKLTAVRHQAVRVHRGRHGRSDARGALRGDDRPNGISTTGRWAMSALDMWPWGAFDRPDEGAWLRVREYDHAWAVCECPAVAVRRDHVPRFLVTEIRPPNVPRRRVGIRHAIQYQCRQCALVSAYYRADQPPRTFSRGFVAVPPVMAESAGLVVAYRARLR